MRTALRRTLVLVGASGLLLAACSSDRGSEPEGASAVETPTVVVTHSLLGDVVENVVGDEADIEVIMPPGTDPHEFAPSAAQIEAISEADLVIANGLGFEAGLLDALDAAEDDGVTVVELGEDLDPLPLGDAEDEHAEEEEHEEGSDDPHWFTDPSRMAEAALPSRSSRPTRTASRLRSRKGQRAGAARGRRVPVVPPGPC
jgi:zinc/manganese transport system substrate-binding protein